MKRFLQKKAKTEYYLMTPEGYGLLKKDIEETKKKIKEVGIRKGEAAGPSSDWHDNAAYEQADQEERGLLFRLSHLKDKLFRAKIVDSKIKSSAEKVMIGNKVKVLFLKSNKEKTFVIVDQESADPTSNRISYGSPIGQALLKRKTGDIVNVLIPSGKEPIQIKILEIE